MSFMGNVIGNKALAAHGKNEYEKALQLYNEAYEKGMDKPRLLRGYSVLLIRMGRLDRALEVLKKLKRCRGLPPRKRRISTSITRLFFRKKGILTARWTFWKMNFGT